MIISILIFLAREARPPNILCLFFSPDLFQSFAATSIQALIRMLGRQESERNFIKAILCAKGAKNNRYFGSR
jgi:hypothetical protein